MTNQELLGFSALASGVYMVQIANMFKNSKDAYGGFSPSQIFSYEVALGVIGLFFSLVGFAIDLGGRPLTGAPLKALAVFLFLWWFAGVGELLLVFLLCSLPSKIPC